MKSKIDGHMILSSQETFKPLQPFDFGLSCSIYTRFEEWTHTAFLDGVLYKCFEESGTPHLLEVFEQGSKIAASLFRQESKVPPGCGSAPGMNHTSEPSSDAKASNLASWILSSDLDLGPLYETADPAFAPLAERFRGLKPPRTATVFEALVIAIIEQQIGLRVAHVLQNRLVERHGLSAKFGEIEFHAFPSPEKLAGLEPQDLRDLGLSMSKSRFILGIAEAVASGELDLEFLKKKTTEDVRDSLISIKGVGRWTADYVLVRGLGRLEAVPYDDLGIRDAVGLFYKGGERATAREAEETLSRFGDYAGVAAYYHLFARFR